MSIFEEPELNVTDAGGTDEQGECSGSWRKHKGWYTALLTQPAKVLAVSPRLCELILPHNQHFLKQTFLLDAVTYR